MDTPVRTENVPATMAKQTSSTGHVMADRAFGRHVTARDDAALAQRRQEAIFLAALDQLPVIVWTTDESLRVTSATGGALRALDLEDDDLATTSLYEYLATHDQASSVIAGHRAALTGESASYELNWRNRFYEAHVQPMWDEAGEIVGVIGVATDVTERKRLEERIREGQKMEALGRLAGSVAHDFNNIMAVILNYARFLSDDLNDEDQRAKDVAEILRAAERARGLINQLLTFSRSDTSSHETVNLNNVVSGMEDLVRRTVGDHVEVKLGLCPELFPISGDRGRIEHALLNLVLNARDAMPDGGTLTIETANEVRGRERHDRRVRAPRKPHVRLSVADTGVGMTPEVASRAFEPFFTTKPPGEGTGLGLASVYGIVEQAGGFVSVESTPGEGSVFHLYFPAVAESAKKDDPTAT
jgi:two-component system, cell cycle sensor histidine kinase and response regulator CckA